MHPLRPPFNRAFHLSVAVFLIAGCLLVSMLEHGQVLRHVNTWQGRFTAPFFLFFTRSAEHLTYALLAIVLLAHRVRYALLFPIAGLVVTLLSNGLKAYFKHPRPGVWMRDQPFVEQIQILPGMELFQGYNSFPFRTHHVRLCYGYPARDLAAQEQLGGILNSGLGNTGRNQPHLSRTALSGRCCIRCFSGRSGRLAFVPPAKTDSL